MKQEIKAQIYLIKRKLGKDSTIALRDYFIANSTMDAVALLSDDEKENIMSIEAVHSAHKCDKISYFVAHENASLKQRTESNLFLFKTHDGDNIYVLAHRISEAFKCVSKSYLEELDSTENLTGGNSEFGKRVFISQSCVKHEDPKLI